MFEFFLPDYPPQSLEIARSEISMQLDVPSKDGRIALWVEISAEAVEVPNAHDMEQTYSIAPTFHTEWLEIPLDALKGGGADLLDGYHLVYEETDDDDQRPGGIYQDAGAGFTRIDMTLSHVGGQDYRVVATGETEFGWTFRIDAVVPLVLVTAVSVREGGRDAPLDEVDEWFGRIFDPSAFPAEWVRKGSDTNGWYLLEGRVPPR